MKNLGITNERNTLEVIQSSAHRIGMFSLVLSVVRELSLAGNGQKIKINEVAALASPIRIPQYSSSADSAATWLSDRDYLRNMLKNSLNEIEQLNIQLSSRASGLTVEMVFEENGTA